MMSGWQGISKAPPQCHFNLQLSLMCMGLIFSLSILLHLIFLMCATDGHFATARDQSLSIAESAQTDMMSSVQAFAKKKKKIIVVTCHKARKKLHPVDLYNHKSK